jgi:hypothetical protein
VGEIHRLTLAYPRYGARAENLLKTLDSRDDQAEIWVSGAGVRVVSMSPSSDLNASGYLKDSMPAGA